MATKYSATSTLPWFWVIETLANYKEVDMSILNGIIERMPSFCDSWGKCAREMVALRCLEELCSMNDEPTDGTSFDLRYGFSLSDDCQDVLQRVLPEVSSSDPRRTGPQLFKWDIRPFIMHKRASLPKCSLELLKDTILEGTDPSVELLVEKGGLAFKNQCKDKSIRDNNEGKNFKSEGVCMRVNSTSGRENGFLQDDLINRVVLPFKRSRSNSVTEDLVGHSHLPNNEKCSDLRFITKKSRLTASCSDQCRIDVVPHTEVEGCNVPDESQVKFSEGKNCADVSHKRSVTQGNTDSNGVNDKNCHFDINKDGAHQIIIVEKLEGNDGQCILPDRPDFREGMQRRVFVDEGKDNVENDFNHKAPIGPSADKPNRQAITNEAADSFEHHSEAETHSDSDIYHGEKADISAKKRDFLSSQTTFSPLAETDWTERNLCMKCSKDGAVLVCSASSCPLAVHENCLGAPANYDNTGNFYCPFCAYSRAISEYLQAKEIASAKRKELAMFITGGFEHGMKNLHKKSLCQNKENQLEQSGQANIKNCHGKGHLEEKKDSSTNHNAEHVKSVDDSHFQHGNDELPLTLSTPHVHDSSLLKGEEQDGEMVIKECISLSETERHTSDGRNSSMRGMETVLVTWGSSEVGTCKELVPEQVTSLSKEAAAAHSADTNETSDVENDKSVSKYSIRFRRREKH